MTVDHRQTTTTDPAADRVEPHESAPAAGCCDAETQIHCCEPSSKPTCCGNDTGVTGGCGCQ